MHHYLGTPQLLRKKASPHVKPSELELDREVKPFWSMYSATEERTYWESAAGLTRSDSLHGAGLKGPWCWYSWSISWDSTTGCSIPWSPSWSQARCRVLCQEEHVSLHRAQHPFLWPPWLQDPGLCSSECVSLEHKEAKSSRQKEPRSLPAFRCRWGCRAGWEKADLGFPLPPLHFSRGVCPASPAVPSGGIHRPGRAGSSKRSTWAPPEFLCCSLMNWCTHPSVWDVTWLVTTSLWLWVVGVYGCINTIFCY